MTMKDGRPGGDDGVDRSGNETCHREELAVAIEHLDVVRSGLERGTLQPEEVRVALASFSERVNRATLAGVKSVQEGWRLNSQRILIALQSRLADANEFNNPNEFRRALQGFCKTYGLQIYPKPGERVSVQRNPIGISYHVLFDTGKNTGKPQTVCAIEIRPDFLTLLVQREDGQFWDPVAIEDIDSYFQGE